MYFESDYDKNLREQRVNNVVKDYGILVRPKVSDVSVSENYAERMRNHIKMNNLYNLLQ